MASRHWCAPHFKVSRQKLCVGMTVPPSGARVVPDSSAYLMTGSATIPPQNLLNLEANAAKHGKACPGRMRLINCAVAINQQLHTADRTMVPGCSASRPWCCLTGRTRAPTWRCTPSSRAPCLGPAPWPLTHVRPALPETRKRRGPCCATDRRHQSRCSDLLQFPITSSLECSSPASASFTCWSTSRPPCGTPISCRSTVCPPRRVASADVPPTDLPPGLVRPTLVAPHSVPAEPQQ